jgi:hypothetical protein
LILAIGQQLVALAAGLMFLLVVWYRPVWAVFATISIASLLDCLEVGAAGLDVGVNVYVDDVACLALLLTGLLVLIRYRKGISRDAVPCLLLMALLALSFSRGLNSFSLKQAGNSVRNLLTFAAPALAIMLLRPVLRLDSGRLARWSAWAGFCFSAVALLRWTGALPMPESLQDNLRSVARTLPADYGFVVGQALIAAIYLLIVERRRGWWWWAGAGMLGVVTLALGHRSVWVATAAGLAWLAFRTGRLSPVRWLGLGATAIVALCFIVVADPTILEFAREIVVTGMTEARSEQSTWTWRVQGYTEATDRVLAGEAIDMLIGPPAGWSANSDGSFASIHIHSRYVDTLAYYGFVGAFAILVWFVVLIKRSRRPAHISSRMQSLSRSSSALLQALLFSEMIYLVPYFGGILQGAALGLLWISATQGAFQQIRWLFAPVYARARFRDISALKASHQ